jgi:hypothetical protein
MLLRRSIVFGEIHQHSLAPDICFVRRRRLSCAIVRIRSDDYVFLSFNLKGLHDLRGHFWHLKSGIGIDDEGLRRFFVDDTAAGIMFVLGRFNFDREPAFFQSLERQGPETFPKP